MKLRWMVADLAAWRRRGVKPVMVLTGARQVGKTTLARGVADEGLEYVALDDPILRSELARVDSQAFARRYPAAILDEVQKIPQLIEVVKTVVDRGGAERYLLLGSSHILLLDRVRESLVGRAWLRRLWPLGLAETLTEAATLGEGPAPEPALVRVLERGDAGVRELPEVLALHPQAADLQWARQRLLAVGGMPALWEGDWTDAELREELATYVTLYLERDLADLARLRDLEPFVRLQRLAAERTATVVNTSELARDAGIAAATAGQYLRYLELSFQVFLLPPFFANPSKRLIKSPRLHWTDVGVWRAVTRRWHELPGPLYESAVIAEFMKVIETFRLDHQPYHLRTYDRREVDLLLVRGSKAMAVEVKAGERVHPGDARHLRDLGEVTGLEHELGLVVYRGREVVELDRGIWAVPDTLLFAPTRERTRPGTRPPPGRRRGAPVG